MKFVHAYALCVLFVTTQIKGAECQQIDDKQTSIKGLTELIASIPQKTRWTKTGRQVDPLHTFIIFGSAQENEPILQRPLTIYPFRQTHFNKNEAKALIKSYGTPFTTYLHKLETKEAAKPFSSDRTLTEQEKSGSNKSEYKNTSPRIFNPQTKQGYVTQITTALQKADNADIMSARQTELTHEIQKSIAALAIRYKHLAPNYEKAQSLEQQLNAYNPRLNDDFVFIINALIDDIKAHNQNTITDQQAINLLFTQGTQFKVAQEKFNMINKETDEYMPEIDQFGNCYGTLPTTLAQCARNVYNSWWTSQGEPALAAELRTANEKLIYVEDVQQKEELQKYISNLRATLYGAMIKNIRTFACQDTTAHDYKQNEEDLAVINDDIAEARAEEQKIAEQLQHVIQKDVPATQAIKHVMGWPKNKLEEAKVMATRLAQHLA